MTLSIPYCDSHAHLSASPLFEQIDGILERAQAAGIKSIVNICTDASNLEQGLLLSKKYPWIYNAAAVHPHDAAQSGEKFLSIVSQHALKGDLVAIGETGLDYHYQHSAPEIQQQLLRRHFQLALSCQLPVIIHCRESFADFFKVLDAEYVVNGKHAPGVLHCFTGTLAEAEEVLSRGWYVSLSGVVTFKKSEGLREVAKMVPLDRLLIETDAPYLAPQSRRGKQNEPSYVVETAEAIAAAKGIPVADVARAAYENMHRLFKLI